MTTSVFTLKRNAVTFSRSYDLTIGADRHAYYDYVTMLDATNRDYYVIEKSADVVQIICKKEENV